MNFIDELQIIDEMPAMNNRKSLFNNNIPGGIRHCEWLMINEEYYLSIQASEYHYCIPRGLIPLEDYTHFEMALIFEGTITTDMSIIKGFDRYDELMDCFDDCIFSEVPKDLIEDLYRWLTVKYN